jgi:hypothetical protein
MISQHLSVLEHGSVFDLDSPPILIHNGKETAAIHALCLEQLPHKLLAGIVLFRGASAGHCVRFGYSKTSNLAQILNTTRSIRSLATYEAIK